jgi:uncharacterized CHY-type Zn-finger protein
MGNKNLEVIAEGAKDTFWNKLRNLFTYKKQDTENNIPICGICRREMTDGGYNGQECSEECYNIAMQISYR